MSIIKSNNVSIKDYAISGLYNLSKDVVNQIMRTIFEENVSRSKTYIIIHMTDVKYSPLLLEVNFVVDDFVGKTEEHGIELMKKLIWRKLLKEVAKDENLRQKHMGDLFYFPSPNQKPGEILPEDVV